MRRSISLLGMHCTNSFQSKKHRNLDCIWCILPILLWKSNLGCIFCSSMLQKKNICQLNNQCILMHPLQNVCLLDMFDISRLSFPTTVQGDIVDIGMHLVLKTILTCSQCMPLYCLSSLIYLWRSLEDTWYKIFVHYLAGFVLLDKRCNFQNHNFCCKTHSCISCKYLALLHFGAILDYNFYNL